MISPIALLWVLVAFGVNAQRVAIPAVLVSFKETWAGVVHSQDNIARASRAVPQVATMRAFIYLPERCETCVEFHRHYCTAPTALQVPARHNILNLMKRSKPIYIMDPMQGQREVPIL